MAVCILVGNSSGFLLHVPIGGSRKKKSVSRYWELPLRNEIGLAMES